MSPPSSGRPDLSEPTYDVTAHELRQKERIELPHLEADFGEDPARFLSFWTKPEQDFYPQGSIWLARSRILGLESMALVRIYRGVENEYFDGRPGVHEWLDQREAELTAADENDTDDPIGTSSPAADTAGQEPVAGDDGPMADTDTILDQEPVRDDDSAERSMRTRQHQLG